MLYFNNIYNDKSNQLLEETKTTVWIDNKAGFSLFFLIMIL